MGERISLEANPKRAATLLKDLLNKGFAEPEPLYDVTDVTATVLDLVWAIKILDKAEPKTIHIEVK